jgi:glycosyltransferase involved in cell wall biosynthesis
LRILYCSQDYSPHDHRFLSALSKTDHQVHWLRLENRNRKLEARDLPHNIHRVPWQIEKGKAHWWQYLYLGREFRSIIKEIKPDLIHAGPLQPVSILPAMAGFHPLVSMSWGFDMLQDAERTVFWKWVTKYVLARSDWLFCDCQTVKKKAIAWGFPEGQISVFPWGVDLSIFKPTANPKKRSKELIFLSTRSWEPRYGIDVALKGFALAVRENPHLHLVMLSGGSQADWVQRFIRENQLEQNIELRGQINNEILSEIYHTAHVYLSASHVDGSSVALMEALACGTPVLVSDIPSNLEWVRDGVEGWVFKDGDAADLARAILRIASQPEMLSAASFNARRTAENKADWKKNFAILLAGYDRALEEVAE